MRDDWRVAHERGLAGQSTKVEQERVPLADGSAIWLRWEVEPWHDATGAIGGIVLFVEDITARVESEEAARAARQDMAELIATIDGIVWEADAQTFRFTFVSAQAERLLGYPVQAMAGRRRFLGGRTSIRSIATRPSATASNAPQAGRNHQFDYRMIAADGRVVWLQDRVTVHVVDGRPETLRGVMVDITDRKRAEAALRESEERFRALADTAPMMVWASNVLTANPISSTSGGLPSSGGSFTRYRPTAGTISCTPTTGRSGPPSSSAPWRSGSPSRSMPARAAPMASIAG